MAITCKLCGKSVDNLSEHLMKVHHIDTWTYSKLVLTRSDLQSSCINCGTPRYLASPGIPGFYIPCICSEDRVQEILKKLGEFQKKTRMDHILTGMVCSWNSLSLGISGNYDELEEVISKSLKKTKLLKDIYYGLSVRSGYPKEISKRNLSGIQVVPFKITVSKDLEITLDKFRFKILPLEKCGYDIRHHNRYSILSKPNKSTRYTKRIRLEGNSCYKFWNNKDYQDTKSIFRLVDPETLEPINISSIPESLLGLLKQVILRNKVTSDLLWSIYNEIVKYTNVLDDQILLKNTITVSELSKISARFTWTPKKDELKDGINISIL